MPFILGSKMLQKILPVTDVT